MKKILITYVSYGSGHKTIAKYISECLSNKKYEIKLVDLLDYMGKTTLTTVKAFDYIYNHRMEKLFSFLYKITDYELTNKAYKSFVKKFIYTKEVQKLYKDFNPDIVISTHFYGSNIASLMKKQKLINSKIVTVVTDYKTHKWWTSSYDKEEIFIVANDIVKKQMLKRKCYSKNIYSFGLPYNEKKVKDMQTKEQIYQKYNLKLDSKCLLFFGGGSNGSLAYLKYLKTLCKINQNYQILFVCGNNKKLYNKASQIKCANLHVLGFITNVYELMQISEFVITKPGGATVTECLEMQKFMLLLPGIGGQEKYNAIFVSKNNYGIMVRYRFRLKSFIKKYVKNPLKYQNAYNNEKVKNESLKQIANLINKL